MKRYVVFGGRIASRSDGDIHSISAHRVAELYGVNPADCELVYENALRRTVIVDDSQIALYPRFDGDYSLTNRILEHENLQKGR